MKKYIVRTVLVMLSIFAVNTMTAQEKIKLDIKIKEKAKYVVLTKKIQQLKPILLTAEALKKEDGAAFGDFQVIICGKEITGITEPEKMNDFMEQAEKLGVQLVACGFSMNKFKVDKRDVPKGMKVVENGIHYNFKLQKEGYLSLSL